ncbi:hypothetical protein RHGRI_022825 [Rhododendron griersonianum]|uniref:Leucine-rich repeat-containing N-terminal plant-type domain-containing protein n=1 Tax=Rhododendron griersonianum TaxID=479676 RepID=A0AAV6J5W8_9ERIC|nr:hypothetical protein RHGRI_022825 [Rhododendron griersonianum]
MLFALLFITITIDFSCGSSTTTIQSNVSSCLENERRALIDFKENLTDKANRLQSWVGKDCCTWIGVGCSGRTGHVIKLDLHNDYEDYFTNQLTGEMTPSFVDLKHLSYLDLSWNNLSASGVDFLGRELILSSNKFDGPLSAVPQSTYVLDLSNNLFSGPIPAGDYDGMSFLILSNNDFSGGIPVSLCNGAGNFQVVDLSKNHLSGKIPRCIGNLSLSVLDFSNCLSVLDLSSNDLHGPIPSSLGFLQRLEYLHLRDNNFHGELPLFLQNLTYMVTLDLGKNAFTGVIPHWIGDKLDNLKFLNLQSNNFYGVLVSEGDRDEDETELMWFWAGVGPGFVVGLLGVFSTLFFKKKWRYAYFQLIEDAYDRIFVAIAVKANWLRRKFHPQR